MKTYLAFAMLSFFLVALPLCAGAMAYAPPASPHADYSFNPGWKLIREDVAGAEQINFDDSKWAGITWYRKHFKLPAGAKDGKVFLEFEGLKQAGRFWVNGKLVGCFEVSN